MTEAFAILGKGFLGAGLTNEADAVSALVSEANRLNETGEKPDGWAISMPAKGSA